MKNVSRDIIYLLPVPLPQRMSKFASWIRRAIYSRYVTISRLHPSAPLPYVLRSWRRLLLRYWTG